MRSNPLCSVNTQFRTTVSHAQQCCPYCLSSLHIGTCISSSSTISLHFWIRSLVVLRMRSTAACAFCCLGMNRQNRGTYKQARRPDVHVHMMTDTPLQMSCPVARNKPKNIQDLQYCPSHAPSSMGADLLRASRSLSELYTLPSERAEGEQTTSQFLFERHHVYTSMMRSHAV